VIQIPTNNVLGVALALFIVSGVAAQVHGQLPPATPRTPSASSPQPPRFIPNPRYGFSGIGVNRANIDLISSPITGRLPAPPQVLIQPSPCPPIYRPPVYYPPICRPVPICPQPPIYVVPRRPVVVVGGSGLTVRGNYRDDRWNVGFHLGTQQQVVVRDSASWVGSPVYTTYQHTTPLRPAIGSNAGSDPRLNPTWLESVSSPTVDDASQQANQQTPLSLLEQGRYWIAVKEPARAAEALRRHLNQNGNDGEAMQLLAIVQAEQRRFDDASAMMRAAYKLDPRLGTQRLDLASVNYSDRELRDLVSRCVIHANRASTGSAWLLVGTLMQAEGRDDLALRMLDRAKSQGLDGSIYDQIAPALRTR
jgi:hypothetical protein